MRAELIRSRIGPYRRGRVHCQPNRVEVQAKPTLNPETAGWQANYPLPLGPPLANLPQVAGILPRTGRCLRLGFANQ